MALIKQNNPWPTVPESRILAFLKNITKLYNKVSYHNVTHAFDVMTVPPPHIQSLDQYLQRYDWKTILSITEHKRIYMLIAAYAHDSGHEGLTNAFYKNGGSNLSGGTLSPL